VAHIGNVDHLAALLWSAHMPLPSSRRHQPG
jgi:hypothetical protein